jgi:NADH pyrophosphatase NudC (nudix superfamily)
MTEDRSLDDFAGADADEESTEPGSDDAANGSVDPVDATDAADASDSADERGVDPAVATSTWHADGAECGRCGERVERRWREEDAFVCADCASW